MSVRSVAPRLHAGAGAGDGAAAEERRRGQSPEALSQSGQPALQR